MTAKERPIPAAVSAIGAGQPVLRPSTGPLRVGQKGEESASDQVEQPTRDVTTPRGHDVVAPRRTGRGGAPAAAGAVAMTVRFDPAENTENDLFILGLREELSRSRLDKAEVVRELLRLAREDQAVRGKLARRLRQAR